MTVILNFWSIGFILAVLDLKEQVITATFSKQISSNWSFLKAWGTVSKCDEFQWLAKRSGMRRSAYPGVCPIVEAHSSDQLQMEVGAFLLPSLFGHLITLSQNGPEGCKPITVSGQMPRISGRSYSGWYFKTLFSSCQYHLILAWFQV